MKKTTFISLFFFTFFIFVLAGCTRATPQNRESSNESDGKMMTKENTEGESMVPESSMATSRYVTYSKEALDSSSDKRRVLFFYANWCPTCIPTDKEFLENSESLPNDVVLIRVNYNDTDTDAEEKALANKYGITYQHTFVQINSKGDSVTKWNGGQMKELLTNLL